MADASPQSISCQSIPEIHNPALEVAPSPPLSKGDSFPISRESLRNCQVKKREYCLEVKVFFAANLGIYCTNP